MLHTREVLSLQSEATPEATRGMLSRVMAELKDLMTAERAGMIEVALAEIVNNIVEHAYAECPDGEIRLTALVDDTLLRFEIRDDGLPLPGGTLPPGRPADLGGGRQALPEGGFGWLLIRSIARDLSYARQDGVNRLTVDFDLSPTGGRARR